MPPPASPGAGRTLPPIPKPHPARERGSVCRTRACGLPSDDGDGDDLDNARGGDGSDDDDDDRDGDGKGDDGTTAEVKF